MTQLTETERVFHSKRYPTLAGLPPVAILAMPSGISGKNQLHASGVAVTGLEDLNHIQAKTMFDKAIYDLLADQLANNPNARPSLTIVPLSPEHEGEPFSSLRVKIGRSKLVTHGTVQLTEGQIRGLKGKVTKLRRVSKNTLGEKRHEQLALEVLEAYRNQIARKLFILSKRLGNAN